MSSSSPLTSTRTSAFTLPLKDPQEEQQQQYPRVCASSTASTSSASTASTVSTPAGADLPPNSDSSAYEEFLSHQQQQPKDSPQSPSLPWLVNYWSTSFFRAPAVIIDQLFVCSSASTAVVDNNCDDYEYQFNNNQEQIVRNNSILRDNSIGRNNSIFSNNSSGGLHYARDSCDDGSSLMNIQRSNPVVDTLPTKISRSKWDALRSVVASHDDFGQESASMLSSFDNSIYPTKKRSKAICRTRKSSIMEEDNDGDDDVRVPAPPSSTTSTSTNYLATTLNTCYSFDQYIDTTQYLCGPTTSTDPTRSSFVEKGASSAKTAARATRPATAATKEKAAPRTPARESRLHERQRRRLQQAARTTSASSSPYPGRSPTPPSPSPSAADTYTTISLSQSFAKEFDSDSETETSSIGCSLEQQDTTEEENLVLDPMASRSSPVRWRLRQRTKTLADPSINESSKNDQQENKYPKFAPAAKSVFKKPFHDKTNHRSGRRHCELDGGDDSTYRYLIRMSPTNYRLEDYSKDRRNDEDDDEDIFSNASPSILMPLHPHQRIMAPLPQDDSYFCDYNDIDNSGFTHFRGSLAMPEF